MVSRAALPVDPRTVPAAQDQDGGRVGKGAALQRKEPRPEIVWQTALTVARARCREQEAQVVQVSTGLGGRRPALMVVLLGAWRGVCRSFLSTPVRRCRLLRQHPHTGDAQPIQLLD